MESGLPVDDKKPENQHGFNSVSGDSATESRESLGSSRSSSESDTSASSPTTQFGWPIAKASSNRQKSNEDVKKIKPHLNSECPVEHTAIMKKPQSEKEMMKERFAKLLLGEDMSGGGKGVCPALTISNAITNLCATVFGQLWRLQPLPAAKISMWQREMDWLLSVTDHIVELKPSSQTLADGQKIEVMTCRPRADLVINLPALRKLDNMLLEILDAFTNTEFWYVDQGIVAPEADGSVSLQMAIHRQEDKWWLPVPRVPPSGLSEDSTKQLHCKLECANQILKAATAINSVALAEMEVPDSYLETLPKNGRACLGDIIYRYITSEQFSPECLLDCLDLSSEHTALEIANRVEAAIYIWRRRQHQKPLAHPHHPATKSSWEIVKELMTYGDKRDLLAERAEKLLLSLKQRVPCLTQTTLDTTKIQCNKDVGKSVLESYSRVLESLAFNIVARIEDLLYVDDITKQSDGKLSSVIPVSGLDSQKSVRVPYSVPTSGTPYRSAYTTPNFSPAPLLSSAREEQTPTPIGNCNNKQARRGLGVKRVLTAYLGSDAKTKNCGHIVMGGTGSVSDRTSERTAYCPWRGGKEPSIHKSSD